MKISQITRYVEILFKEHINSGLTVLRIFSAFKQSEIVGPVYSFIKVNIYH